jgi:F-type H+-transporting ATPase subunit epsilon
VYLEIITPDRKVFAGHIDLIQVPGTKGSFEVLDNHAPIVSTLGEGRVKIYMEGGGVQFFHIDTGVIEVMDNKIILLAETVLT